MFQRDLRHQEKILAVVFDQRFTEVFFLRIKGPECFIAVRCVIGRVAAARTGSFVDRVLHQCGSLVLREKIGPHIMFCQEFRGTEITAETTHEEVIDDLELRCESRTLFFHQRRRFLTVQRDPRTEQKLIFLDAVREREFSAKAEIYIILDHGARFTFRQGYLFSSETAHEGLFRTAQFFDCSKRLVVQI